MKRLALSVVSLLLCTFGAVAFAQQKPATPPFKPVPAAEKADDAPVLSASQTIALQSLDQRETEIRNQFNQVEQAKQQVVAEFEREHPDWVVDPNSGKVTKKIVPPAPKK